MADTSYFVVELSRIEGQVPTPADLQDQMAFLVDLTDKGSLLLSGPLEIPGTGMGILKVVSREAVDEIYQRIPFVARGLATYSVRTIDAKFGTALKAK